MASLLLFSDYIKPIGNKIKFGLIVLARFLKILFRWNKRIELLQLEYSTKYLFDKSYLVIRYRFRNALWYRFASLKSTTEKKVVVFNIERIKRKVIRLVVYGFFRKKTFHIVIQTENILTVDSFKTKIKKFPITEGFTLNPPCTTKKFTIKNHSISLKQTTTQYNSKHIHLKNSLFNQNDFV